MFNIVTQECFQRCVYSLTDGSLKNDEVVTVGVTDDIMIFYSYQPLLKK